MKDSDLDFWDLRGDNRGEGVPESDETIIDESDFKGTQIGANVDNLLLDIKNQLFELNVTLATIGELFSEYIKRTTEE